jgi:hypothetical protein
VNEQGRSTFEPEGAGARGIRDFGLVEPGCSPFDKL